MQEKTIRQHTILGRRDEEVLRQCSVGISSGKRWRREEKISISLESELPSSIPVHSSNPRTFRKYNQSCIARQCSVTRRFHRVFFNTSETARSSWESQQDAESYGETRSNTANYRIPGISTSTVKLQDAQRQNNVTILIEMFEKHRQKNSSLKTRVKSRRSTGSARNHKNYSTT